MSEQEASAERRAQLSLAKQALLEKRLKGALTSPSKAVTIPRRPDSESAPLSFAQERLWFRDQWEPGNPAYNRPVAVRLAGRLHASVLERALGEILHRHEALRATFPSAEGKPVQKLSPFAAFTLPVVDLGEQASGERDAYARHVAAEESRRPFSLATGPLVRATLLRLDEEEHILLLVVHHIVFDGWSAQVLLRELASLYAAFSAHESSPLPDLPVQYADYAYWQRQMLRGAALQSDLAYWEQQLANKPQALAMPTDYPRPAVLSHRGAKQSLAFPEKLTGALRDLSQQNGTTLYMTLLAGFQTLLHRYAAQQDIIVCTPVANRSQEELEGLIGYFNNIIVMRTDLSGDPSFRELLGRVRGVVIGAYEHQNLPFQMLAELPSLAHTPLTRALFALQGFPSQVPALPDLTMSPFDFDKGATDFELSLFMEQRAEGLVGVLEYKTDLFEAATIRGMLENLRELLARAEADPEQQISSLLPPEKITPSSKSDEVQPSRPVTAPSMVARSRPELRAAYVAPRDDLELQIAAIWEEVLGVRPIGIQDSFFDLGGNSLLAMRVFARIGEMCGSPASLSAFFRTPTVAQVAELLRDEKAPQPVESEEESRDPSPQPMRDTFWKGFRNRLFQLIALYAPGFKTTRVRLHRMRGVRIGSNVSIGTSVIIETAYPQLVSIGNNVSISVRSVIIAHFRESTDQAKTSNEPSVRIEDNVYIGAGVIVLPNVTIGHGSVVTAGSVVSQSVPPLTMMQGNPAKAVARCGVPLAGNTYEDFVRNLTPIEG
jgi:acetyltransferase-like isoleucine patch superfamily enzyme